MQGFVGTKHQDDKIISFDRAGLIFVFNFHPNKSFTDYQIGAQTSGRYRIVLDSDEERFGGYGRLEHATEYRTVNQGFGGRRYSMMV